MGTRASQSWVKRNMNRLANKYVGVEFRVIYASNGETAILPVNPETNQVEAANPRVFQVKHYWNRMCEFDKVDPKSTFVVFSDKNPFQREYNDAMALLQVGK